MSMFSGSANPSKFNYTIQRGATFIAPESWTVNGVPFDFTGWTLAAHIRPNYSASTALAASFDFLFIGPPSSGSFNLTLPAVSSSLLTGSCYYYDIRITSGSEVHYLGEGKLTVSPSITRG